MIDIGDELLVGADAIAVFLFKTPQGESASSTLSLFARAMSPMANTATSSPTCRLIFTRHSRNMRGIF